MICPQRLVPQRSGYDRPMTVAHVVVEVFDEVRVVAGCCCDAEHSLCAGRGRSEGACICPTTRWYGEAISRLCGVMHPIFDDKRGPTRAKDTKGRKMNQLLFGVDWVAPTTQLHCQLRGVNRLVYLIAQRSIHETGHLC